MLGHTPQCSGVSTQVLAECTPALAGEGRKNRKASWCHKRAPTSQARRRAETVYTLEAELAKVARAEGRPRPPAVRTASRKGSNDQLQIGLGCAERRRVGRDRRAARARREHRSAAGAVPLTWLCRAGQCLNDHIAGAVSTAIAATARWRASAASAGERRQRGRAPPAHGRAAACGRVPPRCRASSHLGRYARVPGRPTAYMIMRRKCTTHI